MLSLSAYQTGLSGIQRGMSQAQRAAGEIANFGTDKQTRHIAEPITELKSAEVSVAASAKTMRVASDTLGTLIDTLS